jgi:hypothetical protein
LGQSELSRREGKNSLDRIDAISLSYSSPSNLLGHPAREEGETDMTSPSLPARDRKSHNSHRPSFAEALKLDLLVSTTLLDCRRHPALRAIAETVCFYQSCCELR